MPFLALNLVHTSNLTIFKTLFLFKHFLKVTREQSRMPKQPYVFLFLPLSLN